MGFKVRQKNGCEIFVLSGEVDFSHGAETRKALLACIGAQHDVLVDLSGVSYLGSCGVANLIEALHAARERRVRFGVIGAHAQSRAMLELTGLHRCLELHESVEGQMSAWRAGTRAPAPSA